MKALLAVCNSEGCRHCDAKCYNAKQEDCECVCGGRNHGVGKKQAMSNVSAIARVWIKEAGYEMDDDGRLVRSDRQAIEYPA